MSTPGYGATAEAIFKMTVGNQIGVKLADGISVDDLFAPAYGSFIIELADTAKVPAVSNLVEVSEVGETTEAYQFVAAGERPGKRPRSSVSFSGCSPSRPDSPGSTRVFMTSAVCLLCCQAPRCSSWGPRIPYSRL